MSGTVNARNIFLVLPSYTLQLADCFVVVVLVQENGASFEGSMLKLLRTLPKVLKYLPSDKAAVILCDTACAVAVRARIVVQAGAR